MAYSDIAIFPNVYSNDWLKQCLAMFLLLRLCTPFLKETLVIVSGEWCWYYIWNPLNTPEVRLSCNVSSSIYICTRKVRCLIWKYKLPWHISLSSVYNNLFYFDCETSSFCLCRPRSNPFLEPTSTKHIDTYIPLTHLLHFHIYYNSLCDINTSSFKH